MTTKSVPYSATDADSSNVKSRDTGTGAALYFVFSGAAVSVIDLNCTLGYTTPRTKSTSAIRSPHTSPTRSPAKAPAARRP